MTYLFASSLATATGIAAHHGLFISGEWHTHAPAILFVHVGLHLILWTGSRFLIEQSIFAAWLQASTLAACYLSALFSSILVYRVFFHRCCAFPGPVMARTSNLWHVWKARRSQNHLWLDELHHKYGDFVRTGPNEITVFDSAGFKATNGFASKCTKSVWYDIMLPNYSIISTRDRKLHDERRRVWRPAFSPEALKTYQPRVLENVDKVDRIIGKAASSSDNVDVTRLSYWFSFDVMGEFAFNKSFNMLEDEQYHEVIIKLRRAFELLGPFSPVVWLVDLALMLLPRVWRMKDWNEMMGYCHQQIKERVKINPEKADIASYLIVDAEKNGFTPMDKKFLNGDAVTVIVAGSDSSAPVVTFGLYLLAKHPEQAEKLFKEIINLDVRDSQALQDLPHLNAIIHETLRLYPPVPTAVQRTTPDQGVRIADQHIPGGTVVAVPRYTIGRSERYFEKADQFIPERWYSRPEMVKDHTAYAPFNVGKSSCIGQSLAMSDLRLILSRIVSKYQFNFTPGTDPELVHLKMEDNFTLAPGPLSLTFKHRYLVPGEH